MLTESFVAATLSANKASQHASSTLKDVGIFLHEFQPQSVIRHGYKKSSINPHCLAISDSHVFASQADKAVINVYSRDKGNHEATVPFPERIQSLAYANHAAILILGTAGGKLILWEVATGRMSTSAASHLQPVSSISISGHDDCVLSGSKDTNVHVWSLSSLVAIRKPTDSFGNEIISNAPLRTFSSHRNAITALSCGHSKFSTNFAVSACEDQTCYIWHIDTCQVLRTYLLPSMPLCIAIDPVDRAIYLGDAEGRITMVDIISNPSGDKISARSSAVNLPTQVSTDNFWVSPSGQMGSANCLTISYDGTALVSGHSSGVIVKWDIPKGKVLNEVTNLAQPVTNIQMLKPEGLPYERPNCYRLVNVVRPKLDFNAQMDNGNCGVPAGYTFQAVLSSSTAPEADAKDATYKALTETGFPPQVLDDAIHALLIGSSLAGVSVNTERDDQNLSQIENLKEHVAKLKQQIAVMNDVEQKQNQRRMARIEKREELGLKKRQAYFDAKKQGKDGDAAMKKWEEEEAMVDVESDDEYLGEGMDIG